MLSSRFNTLVDEILAIVHLDVAPAIAAERTAAALGPHLRALNLLNEEHRAPDPDGYRQHVLYADLQGRFSIVSLVWLPGQATPIHDHVSRCVVGVHEGRELETRYRLVSTDDAIELEETGLTINPAGTIAALTPPRDVHRVANPGPSLAVSLHIYGADIRALGSSIRRRYDLTVRRTAG